MGAYALHALGGTNTGPARKAFLAKFEAEVDPDGLLSEAERQKRAEYARKCHFAQMGLKSAKTRAKKRTNKKLRPSDVSLQVASDGRSPKPMIGASAGEIDFTTWRYSRHPNES